MENPADSTHEHGLPGRSDVEMHDATIQALFGAELWLEAAQEMIYEEPEEAHRALDSAINGILVLIDDLRGRIESLDRRKAWSHERWRA